MTEPVHEDRRAALWARASGLLLIYYIAAALIGGQLISGFHVPNDFTQTAENIKAGEALYRFGLLIRLSADLTAIAVGFTLWALLQSIDAELALFGLLWRVSEGIVGIVASLFRAMTLGLAETQSSPDAGLAALLSSGATAAFSLGVLLFSIGSLIFFRLFARSSYLPLWLAWAGVVGSLCALLLALVLLLSPGPVRYLEILWAPLLVAELGAGLLLLTRGVGSSARSAGKMAV